MRSVPEQPEIRLPRNLVFPSIEEIEKADPSSLKKIWQENDRILLEALFHNRPTFFGLHGAARSDLEKIKAIPNSNAELLLQTTTFFKTPESPRELLDTLYHNAQYSSSYAFFRMNRDKFNSPGGLAVIDLSSDDGQNISRNEREFTSSPRFPAIKAAVGVITIKVNNYKRIAGFIEGEDFVKYANFSEKKAGLSRSAKEETARNAAGWQMSWGEGFLTQKVAFEALKLFKVIE